ncbi:MAG: NIPSNAP family protein [Rhodospirillales bacterium]|jgi:hypothetical protein
MMIVEKRTYTLKPGTAPIYMKIYEEFGLEVQTRILGNMFGWFVPEIGELNQIVHMWGYNSIADRESRRKELDKAPEWAEFRKNLRSKEIVVKQDTQILNPAPWCPNTNFK